MQSTPFNFDSEQTEMWRTWMLASRTMAAHLDKVLEMAAGIPLIDFEILCELLDSLEPRRMCDVGAAVALTRSGATRAITRLEKQNLVRRLPSQVDKRSTVVEITDNGRSRHADAVGAFTKAVQTNFFDPADDADLRAMRRASYLIRQTTTGSPICQRELARLYGDEFGMQEADTEGSDDTDLCALAV